MVLETPVLLDESSAMLRFNGVEPVLREPYTYFVPSRPAVIGMAYLAGYEVLAERVLPKPFSRCTYLLRAVSRERLLSLEACPPYVKEMLKRDIVDLEFNHKMLERSRVLSNACLRVPVPRDGVLSPAAEVNFPYHPKQGTLGHGVTAWETPTGNHKVF